MATNPWKLATLVSTLACAALAAALYFAWQGPLPAAPTPSPDGFVEKGAGNSAVHVAAELNELRALAEAGRKVPELIERSARAEARVAELESRLERAPAADPALAQGLAELDAANRSLRAELETLRAASGPAAPESPAKLGSTAFRFGLGEKKTPAFDATDWPTMSGNVMDMSTLMPGFAEVLARGEMPSDAMMRKVQEHNLPLASFAIAVAGELGGTGPNGAFTHPAVIANLVRGTLEAAGRPLDVSQEAAIVALGEAWAGDAAWRKSNLPQDAPPLALTVEEVDGKLRFLRALKDVLAPEQAKLLFDPATEGRVGLDLLSPGLVYIIRNPVTAPSREKIEAAVVEALFRGADIEDLEPGAWDWVGRSWIDALPFAREPVPQDSLDLILPRVEQVQAAARAQLAAMEQVAALGRLTPEQTRDLRSLSTVILPRIVETK